MMTSEHGIEADSSINDAVEFINSFVREEDAKKTVEAYSQSVDVYEKGMGNANHKGALLTIESFLKLGVDVNTRIVDIGAGTGALAKLLRPAGYCNIDAIDGSERMLERAKEQNLYQNYILSIVGQGHILPIENDTYDAMIMSAVFCPGHMGTDAFPELIRIMKPGGIIIWAMRAPHLYADMSEKYRDGRFEADVEEMVQKGKWKHYNPPRTIPYFHGHEGVVFTMEVL
ncbi:probable cycloartenol-C-24-methyltransferase 1 [Limulus polyphemus]|uniref:Probable cycloartenol-C-24-methyltransferase 1 n=1 Tax=Limulus polyphemus TaxID=6850 RepID=A0ABM1S2V7_LIMPO|nr:probable cycloartenol-C-24-methyltransferase 1 [Limulus polyphemus]XP_022237963.1 probable cycloartenol-C-24-methyltransferase 1 [Limulus polyphemus]XP_022237964.1 probable cycloartenol-C-24-methyltransferase 1 [Limulus polyphemus]